MCLSLGVQMRIGVDHLNFINKHTHTTYVPHTS